jgi:hypothetical protein
MPVIAHIAATVAPVYANFMRVLPDVSPVRDDLSAVRAQFRTRSALASVAAIFPDIATQVARISASLMPVLMNVSGVRLNLSAVCA